MIAHLTQVFTTTSQLLQRLDGSVEGAALLLLLAAQAGDFMRECDFFGQHYHIRQNLQTGCIEICPELPSEPGHQ